jgi:endonuclease YncB( thermonuclease family)
VAQDVAAFFTVVFGLAIAAGMGLLLYYYWQAALAILLAMALAARWSFTAASVAFLSVLLVVLEGINSTRAQTVVDGDTLKVGGTPYRIWGIDAAESKQERAGDRRRARGAQARLREALGLAR